MIVGGALILGGLSSLGIVSVGISLMIAGGLALGGWAIQAYQRKNWDLTSLFYVGMGLFVGGFYTFEDLPAGIPLFVAGGILIIIGIAKGGIFQKKQSLDEEGSDTKDKDASEHTPGE